MGDVAAAMRLKEIEAQARKRAGTRNAALEADYTAWLKNYYPKAVNRPMGYFHREFWEWLWKLKADAPHPEFDAGFGIWFRGAGKTTSGQLAIVVLGAKRLRHYGWLLSRTQAQANQKLLTIRSAISRMGSEFLRDYSHMAKATTETGQNLGWNTTRLVCGDDDKRFVLESIGLDMAVRGANVEFQRPDFLTLDDVDALHDSPYMVEKNIETLTQSILPAGSSDLAVLGLQNLIHQDSIFAQIADGRAKFLRNRIIFGLNQPVPAFEGDFKYEERETPRGPRYFITSGVPTWAEGFGIAEAEKELNEIGPAAFESEDQHNVSRVHEDATFREFDPVYHVITQSEFMWFFVGRKAHGVDYRPLIVRFDGGVASRFILPRGDTAMAQDWGNNIKHPCGTRWMWRPGENQPLTDSVFFIREMVWPTFPPIQNDPRANPSYGQLHKAMLEYEKDAGIGGLPLEKKRNDGDDVAPRLEAVEMRFRLVSHERPEAAAAYRKDFGKPLHFQPIDTAEAKEGVLHLQEFLHVNFDEYHPFRIDPRTFDSIPAHDCAVCGWRHAGEHLKGRPRDFYVVTDGQGELFVDKTGKLQVKPAVDELGMARTRWEYPRHRPKHSTEGEEKPAPKRDDEMVDTDRALAGRIYSLVKSLSAEQRVRFIVNQKLVEHGFKPFDQPYDNAYFEMTARMHATKWAQEAARPLRYGIGNDEDLDDAHIDGVASGRGF